eukprot:CAMPEP_0119033874 /NCGR_PEP_ID=MMETSP1177-20130426/944_1 /TAXON_ID=2985 /ORGANISM="Ochromonas sp, Strain CCMP1899" /LENGTH=487 /DNA_ID=CAMNT_0006990967 /DNA_START=352 /DNA_END=1815 /DNA_ORIENTATION=-
MIEAKEQVGGNLISRKEDGFQWEEGPNSFQPSPTILRFAKDLGVIDELFLADSTLPRFVYWEGKLFPLPAKLSDPVLNFNLMTWPGKIRAGLGAVGLIAARPKEEESVKQFVTRHLGAETFERVIDPFVSGVYAGNPDNLSMRAALKKVANLEDLGFNSGILSGALVRMGQLNEEKIKNKERDADLPVVMGGSLGTFKNGLQTLPLKVAEILGDKSKINHKMISLRKEGEDWISTFDTPQGVQIFHSKSVIMTAPGYVAAKLVGGEDGVLPEASALGDVYYPPVASVTIAYPNSAFKDESYLNEEGAIRGFGHLIPRKMKVRTLGTIWSSSLFPGRAPPGYTLLLNYIGGAQDTGIALLSKEEIVAQVHADVKKILLKDDAEPPKVLGVRVWPQAIPQYQRGHLELVAGVEKASKAIPGLYLGGNYKTGVAFGDCVQYGCDVATEVTKFLTADDTTEGNIEANVESIGNIMKEVETVKQEENVPMSS